MGRRLGCALVVLGALGCEDTPAAHSDESSALSLAVLDGDAQVPVGLTQLTKAHVDNLEPGNAQGQAAAGTYVADHAAPASFRCFCRVGSCAAALQKENAPRGVLTVRQSAGALAVELSGSGYEGSCTGGISAAGALSCGQTASDTDQHREFFRLSGQLGNASDGARTLELELMVTRRKQSADGLVDCDTWSAMTAREQR